MKDSHCDQIFADYNDYQGCGFVEGTNGVDTVFSRNTVEINYLLPAGSHFDERIKVAPQDYNIDGKYFTLMLEYFDVNHSQTPLACYALFNESYYEMDVHLSEEGLGDFTFSIESYSVFFTANFYPLQQCEPYAFICKTSKNKFVRLPEDGDYFFGTEWIDWKWSNYSKYGKGYECKENHYYWDGEEWIVNGGPTLTTDDIWYYQDTDNYGQCLGCSKIYRLECIEDCITSDFDNDICSECPNIFIPTYQPTSQPSGGSGSKNNGATVAIIITVVLVVILINRLAAVETDIK